MIYFVGFLVALAALLGGYLGWGAMRTRKLAAQAEAAVPPLGRFLTISTGQLHYTDEGAGPAIVMIHGLGGQLRNFTLSLTERLTANHRVITLDRPGMGYSDRPEAASASLEAQAGYVLELIDALGLKRPLIVGHSLGGAIAMAMALRAPDKLRGLALLAPLLRRVEEPDDMFNGLEIGSNTLRRLLAHTIAIPMTIRNLHKTMDVVFGPDPIPRNYTVAGGGLLSLRPKSFINTSRDYMAVESSITSQQQRYDELTLPVAVLYGTQDRMLDHTAQGLDVARDHRQIKLELVEGAGHMLPVNHPDHCASFIRKFDARL